MNKKGFTLLEVLIALGIFVFGAVAVTGLYIGNANSVQLAKEEVIVALIQRDLYAKNQFRAYYAGRLGHEPFVQGGVLSLKRPPDDPEEPKTPEWVIRCVADYNKMMSGTKREWGDIDAYHGFYFFCWEVSSPRIEDNQFVDWNGYGEIAARELDSPWFGQAAGGGEDPGNATINCGDPAPSHNVKYDSERMRWYQKRLRAFIFWDLTKIDPGWGNLNEITDGEKQKTIIKQIKDGRMARYVEFDFGIYNPDLRKR
ncbi:MAG: prepilin-type N-terminal cleavage/methylation domain-containing protein [Planctomycetota bacterium]|nr:prepilin-type N-terminal cleavage/methylation domain-containing protein [Planctomycetota bacterium]